MSLSTAVTGVTLIWRPTVTQIASVALDASISEKHLTKVDTTDSPVEQGTDITDHLRRKPDELTIEGVVTNYPIGTNPSNGEAGQVQVSSSGNGTQNSFTYQATASYTLGRAEDAYATLLLLAGSSELVTVVTSIRTYVNMALTSLEVPRNAQVGEALRFTATFKEIQIVENASVSVAISQPSGVPNKDAGKAPAAPEGSIATIAVNGVVQTIGSAWNSLKSYYQGLAISQ